MPLSSRQPKSGQAALRRRAAPLLLLALAWLFALAVMSPAPRASAAAEASSGASTGAGAVYVIPVKMTVERGLASFLKRALNEAKEAKASTIVLTIDTPGGSLKSADEIGKLIRSSEVPTIAYVDGKAASAGAYLALNAGGIAMSPGSTIGAAMVVDGSGQAVESPKTVSFWTSEMVAAAQLHGRDAAIAAGMVDPSRVVELKALGQTKQRGEIISLSADDASKVGYADSVAGSLDELLEAQGLADRAVIHLTPSWAEKVSQALTSPGVTTLLLMLGIAGVLIELFVPGFGVPGIVGVAAFGLYFFGQYIAGFAGSESIVLFALGLVFLIAELFVPSFGILGILGMAGLASGIATAAYDKEDALQSLLIAFLIAVVVAGGFAYLFRRRGIWNRFILRDKLSTEAGYIPNESRDVWLGKEGVALSPLRPSGVAEVEGTRIDVVTSGEFVEAGSRIRVTAADGTRIVVARRDRVQG